MRLLLLVIIAAIAAHFTIPTSEALQAQARATLGAYQQPDRAADARSPSVIDDALGYVRGMIAGSGRYESYYVFSKLSVDMPGAEFLECYGAFTLVRCSVVHPGENAGG